VILLHAFLQPYDGDFCVYLMVDNSAEDLHIRSVSGISTAAMATLFAPFTGVQKFPDVLIK